MAKYTQEDVEKIRDSLKEQHNYDDMSDEQKKTFDEAFDAEIDKYREQGLVEEKKKNNNDGTEDDGDVDNERGREIEPGKGQDGENKKGQEESKNDYEAVKARENELLDAQIEKNQRLMDAERHKQAEEKKDRDHGDRERW